MEKVHIRIRLKQHVLHNCISIKKGEKRMKSILISIRPEWTAKILNGEKTIEVRKTAPKCDLPIEVYIYCTKTGYIGHISNRYIGRVVAKFTLREVEKITKRTIWGEWEVYGEHTGFIELSRMSCLEQREIMDYMGGNYHAYAWRISDLVIFDEPMELKEFRRIVPDNGKYSSCFVCKRFGSGCNSCSLTKAPQSWQYVEEKA